MAFSVEVYSPTPIQPVLQTHTLASTMPQGGKPQLTPTLDIEPTVISKWTPVIAFPVFAR